MQDIKANIHNLVCLVGLSTAAETLNLTLQGTPKDVLHHAGCRGPIIVVPHEPQLSETKASVVASVNYVTQELVGILLPAQSKVLCKYPETALDLGGSILGEIQAQRPNNALLQYAEGAVAFPIGSGITWKINEAVKECISGWER